MSDKHTHKHIDKIKVEKKDSGEAVITGELTLDLINEVRPSAIKTLNNSVKIDGFRSGSIPEQVLVKNIGEMKILEEVAELALAREYGSILHEAKLSPIGRPQVAITKLAPGIPLEFKITVTLEPEFDLPDYKKIAKEVKSEDKLEVSDAEVDAVLEEIKKQKWEPKLKEGENLRDKAKENLLAEKKHRAMEKKRLTIVDNLVKEAKINIPVLMIDAELERMLGQFKEDVSRHSMKWDEYLKSINKSEADIRNEWREKAEGRVKAELIMAKIAETEKIEPTSEELEHETEHLLSHYKDADPLRVRLYVYQMMKNQKVLEFLETIK